MKTYWVSNSLLDEGRIKPVRAANINNLRKGLMVGLRPRTKKYVYADKTRNDLLGILGRVPKDADPIWPEYLWMSKGNYKVNKDGTIRRL